VGRSDGSAIPHLEELAPALIEHVRAEHARGELRDDVPAEKIGFVSIG